MGSFMFIQVERLQRKFSQIHSTLAVRGSAAASIPSTLTSQAKPFPSTGPHMSDWPAGGGLDSSASQLHCSSVLRDSASSASLTALAQKMKGVGLSQATGVSSSGWGSGSGGASASAAPPGSSRGINPGPGTASPATSSRGPVAAGGTKGGEGGSSAKAAAGDANGASAPGSIVGAGQTGGERRGVGPLASGMGSAVGGKGHERPGTSQGRDTGSGLAADRSGPKAHMIASMVGLPGK